MDRRAFLKSAAATGALSAAGSFATPAISQRAAARSLRFVPQADLANFDPIWGTQYVVRNASVLVWDTLYGVDEKLQPKRQMVEGEDASADGLTWTFRLRPGLKCNDSTPVLARRGPKRFVKVQGVPGAKSVFEKFADSGPRQEPASWLAGGKRMMVDRIEWIVMPDPATAAAALQNGEVDWWENPISDLVPLLRRNRNIAVDIADPLGNVGSFRMNHLHPPFNDVRARRAILMAMNQEDYMRALVGDDDKLWKRLPGFFTPGTPLYTEEGGDILKGARNLDAAKKLLAESGYAGQPVTCLVAQDQPITKAQGDITADLLKRLGINVDFAAIDWGTVGARRSVKTPPGQGGWQMFHTWPSGPDGVN